LRGAVVYHGLCSYKIGFQMYLTLLLVDKRQTFFA